MRHINLDTVEPGQVLGKSIYANDGRTLLQSGVSLTPGMINTLRRIGVTMIYILQKEFEDVKIEDVVSDETRRNGISRVSEALQCVQSGKDFDTKAISQAASKIIEEVLRNRNVLLSLSDIRTKENYMFIHAINVCIMSTIIGANMDFNSSLLKDLAIGALLHDIGKVYESSTTMQLRKPKEQDHHSWIGFNLLRKKHDINLSSAHIALQHHENIDGTGSPRGIMGDQIHVFGKITSVANHFDNMISGAFSGTMYLPYEASEHLMVLAGNTLDLDIVIKFLRSIAIYPTGSSVKLSTGEVGVVVNQHKGLPSRPVIRVIKRDQIRDTFTNEEHEVKEIDLSKEPTIFIKNVVK
jgi:HD-GYP domain-containing protein (c-di-GMP phosphodiesterase class II)